MRTLNKRSLIAGAALLIFCTGMAACVMIREFRGQPVIESLKAARLAWLLPGLASMLFYSFAEALNLRRALALAGNRASFRQCIGYALCGFFFSSITPSASGGQPAQLYLMKRGGINLSFGAFSLLAGVVSFQVSSVFLGICGAVYVRQAGIIKNSSSFLLLFIVGFAINFVVLMLELCIMFSERSNSLIEKLLKIIAGKFAKKNADAEISERMEEYRIVSALLRKNRAASVRMLFTSVIQLILYHSIPFFCAKALGLNASWLKCMLIQSMLFVSVSSLPLPGASGVTEAGFAALFGSAFSGSDLACLLILSRCVSFVIPLIFSGISVLAGAVSPSARHSAPD